MYTTASELLQAVYDDLKVPGRRCKGYYALGKNGKPIHWSSPKAARYSTDGKLLASCGEERAGSLIVVRRDMSPVYETAMSALYATRPIESGSAETNNDDLDDEQWAAWMEAAIQYAKAQEAAG